ncbi:RCC1 domain-containing protein [Hydrogenibacillus schlegelii]|uniref:RCC1 domain-containing protein n=1 Tax=Hydrogenibacillus schlegelii TaxID=1484 RepID=UPI0023566F4F|nr:RCC1 domain-containing protein [Hydrogenibacillus schlegelii]
MMSDIKKTTRLFPLIFIFLVTITGCFGQSPQSISENSLSAPKDKDSSTSNANLTEINSNPQENFSVPKELRLFVWGEYYNDRIGRYVSNRTPFPVLVPELTDVVQVAIGSTHVLALTRDGTVWAWGENDLNQLGDGTPKESVYTCPGEKLVGSKSDCN